ncbi:DUF3068 domain-containing protein [Gordonia amarae]|uniref:DUF3068 domain-containing protein n=2 Tax=Gordonia amarae TaxID=36821 RepID=G7GRQ8_9ACTN|nr:DUF3068 domain-containing protein [Gordonia amarae]MCS3877019.1 hypothetical protein [Gordonia amarae]QHN15836.1 DUF3068 domain-containing protein [Gordonia amarae]QHN20404.1 DUF3068 domain-containing protein [Gordonia amarae]QHN29256.1 DUF3068 domain-containing protein [Gordonia amarae]QHN38035.1 DUF3068 domain-containing protein [Gordonia amarae]
MRRIWPALLALFGFAFITAAILIPTVLVSQLRVVPLDLDITSDATTVSADGDAGDRFPAVVLDRCSLTEKKVRQLDAHLTQQRRSVIIDPSSKTRATVQSAQTVRIDRVRDADGKETDLSFAAAGEQRTCKDGLLSATIDRISVNRKTSVPDGKVHSIQFEALPEGGNLEDVSVDVPRQGFQYKFGFDVKKRPYLYFDTNTRTDNPANFVGETTLKGVKVYEFVSEVPETDLSELPNPQGEASLGTLLTQPASWWGITGKGIKPGDPVTMHRYAKATRHVFVEPVTGTILDGKEDQEQYYRSPDQSEAMPTAIREYKLHALKGTFKWADSTVARQADKADHYKGLLNMAKFWLPLILGILGALLILAWLLLFLRDRRKPAGDGPSDSAFDYEAPSATAAGTTTAWSAPQATEAEYPADEGATAILPRDDEPTTPGIGPWDRPTEQIPNLNQGDEPDDPLRKR